MSEPPVPAEPEPPDPFLPGEDGAPGGGDDAARPGPHPPGEALALFVVGLLLFWGTLALPGAKGTLLGDMLPALRVLAWVAPAYWLIVRRGRDPLVEHALLVRPHDLGRATAVSLVILLLFVPLYVAWQRHEGRVAHYVGSLHGSDLVLLFLAQAALVASYEEYFFRGVLQPSLERPEGPRFRLLGAPFGRGALLATALFALCHLVSDPRPVRLLTFFPGLWFAWLRARTGSIAPGLVAHALANTLERASFEAYWGLPP